MPLIIRVRNPTAPVSTYLADSQPLYDNTFIPCLDIKKDHQDDIHVTNHEDVEVEEFAREVPYYAEEEAFPEEFCTEAEPAVDVPDMMHELQAYFPSTSTARWMPPPPPVHATAATFRSLHFWYSRLLAHPLIASCNRLAGYACPTPQEAATDDEWASECSRWWETLCTATQGRDVTEVSVKRSWNPYSLTHNVRYHEPRNTTAMTPSAAAQVDARAARFPVPPPPEYDIFSCEYAAKLGNAFSQRMYVQALVRWWRMAAQWAAATGLSRPWVCPPPTTGASPAAWGHALDHWWSLTTMEAKAEDEKALRQQVAASKAANTTPAMTPRATTVDTSSCGASVMSTSLTYPSGPRCASYAKQLW